ncbi:hypothetical protein V490_07461 [Pseudogymnoascus sp. VKM F-3557]|nr:hypothetical protein V490_07461 [Pseudogymnoascus sp. VKM F-3557]
MLRAGRTRGLPVQDPEDNALGPCSPSSITMSPPRSKRPLGRLREKPLGSKNPRTALAYKISDPAIASTSTPIIATPSSRVLRSAALLNHTASDDVVHTKKRKRIFLKEACPTDSQTVCEGCGRRSSHGENLDEAVIICYKCKKDWHPLCIATKGTKSLVAPCQWECYKCSKTVKLQPLPASTNSTGAEVSLDRHARDTTYEADLHDLTEELDMPRITDDYVDLVSFRKTAVVQARKVYEEAKGIFNNVLSERDTCRERLDKLILEIEQCGNGLEEYRRQFDSDSVQPGNGEPEHSTSHRLALGICGDSYWIGNMSAKLDLIRAQKRHLTGRLKALRGDLEIKTAILKHHEQQSSMVSVCLQTSCTVFEKLRSKITMGDSCEDSDSVSETTMEVSVTEDTSPKYLAGGSERLDEETQQDMMENSYSKEDRGQMREPSRLPETAELPQIPLRTEEIQIQQELPQTPEPAKGPKQSDTVNRTGLQETIPRPSSLTINIPSSDLGEGQNLSLATSISKQSDKSNSSEPSSISLLTEDTTIITEHRFSIPAEADSTATGSSYENVSKSKSRPPVLGPSCSEPPANSMRNNIVPPPTSSFSPTDDALQSPVLQSPIPLRDLTASEAGTRNNFATGPVWMPGPSFRERIGLALVNGDDKTKIPTLTGFTTRGDLRSLVPNPGYLLTDAIIDKYLKCLTQHINAQRERNVLDSDTPYSSNKIAFIGSMDRITTGLLKDFATFYQIYIPIKLSNCHWMIAVLYPGSSGQRGRTELYDSHQHWTNNIMTRDDVSYFLKYRLRNEYSPEDWDWTQNPQQRSRPQRSDADSGLYVLANAKSIALNIGRIDLDSRSQSVSLRWQLAEELLTESIVRAF